MEHRYETNTIDVPFFLDSDFNTALPQDGFRRVPSLKLISYKISKWHRSVKRNIEEKQKIAKKFFTYDFVWHSGEIKIKPPPQA